jgi:hypothetical protein
MKNIFFLSKKLAHIIFTKHNIQYIVFISGYKQEGPSSNKFSDYHFVKQQIVILYGLHSSQ